MSRKTRFHTAKNFALYYGVGQSKVLSELDIAIVEPLGQTQADIKQMQAKGTLVLAYLSVMEIDPLWPEVGLLKLEDFLRNGEVILLNSDYGNYLVDLRSERWIGLLINKVGNLINKQGYDGIFLDTIGDVEGSYFLPQTRNQLLLAAADFVRRLSMAYPEHVLIQNCGLEALLPLTAPYLDAVCWENPPFGRSECTLWVNEVVRQLERLKVRDGIRIILLFEDNSVAKQDTESHEIVKLARKIADEQGYLLYIAAKGYTFL